MHDTQKVIVGIAVFLIVVTFPIWFSLAQGGSGEKVTYDVELEGDCLRPAEEMRATHMEILEDWRDSVVREGRRLVEIEGLPGPHGGKWEMSLTRTCLSSGCHGSKEAFCDRCHDYANVTPYCWDCHVEPKGAE